MDALASQFVLASDESARRALIEQANAQAKKFTVNSPRRESAGSSSLTGWAVGSAALS
jgi:hypothetical protein